MKKIPAFANKTELFAHLKANKDIYIAEKKMEMKKADSVNHFVLAVDGKQEITKAIAANAASYSGNKLNCVLIINTTNIMDSHSDVHLPGIWNKSLKEVKLLYLLQEHEMSFEGIISDEIKATAKMMSWKELGYDAPGETQALVFTTSIDKERNTYMYEQYLKGRVKNHSVGMQYVKVDLAINSESKLDEEEKAVWDKYINDIVNKAQVEEQGYFWAVSEAKVVEGSAVPIGSNQVTPAYSVEGKTGMVQCPSCNKDTANTESGMGVITCSNCQVAFSSNKAKPSADTPPPAEPPLGTQKKINYEFITNHFKQN